MVNKRGVKLLSGPHSVFYKKKIKDLSYHIYFNTLNKILYIILRRTLMKINNNTRVYTHTQIQLFLCIRMTLI